MFSIVDDGTLDIVVKCETCYEEARYNDYDDFDEGDEEAREDFVTWCLDDSAERHVCREGC